MTNELKKASSFFFQENRSRSCQSDTDNINDFSFTMEKSELFNANKMMKLLENRICTIYTSDTKYKINV